MYCNPKKMLFAKSAELIEMSANMSAVTYKIINFIFWKATIVGVDNYVIAFGGEVVETCNIKEGDYSKLLSNQVKIIDSTIAEIGGKRTKLISEIEYEKGLLKAKVHPNIRHMIKYVDPVTEAIVL